MKFCDKVHCFTQGPRFKGRLYASKPLAAFLSLTAVFALHCRFEVYLGSFTQPLLNGINKLSNTVIFGIDFLDIFTFLGIYFLLRFAFEKDEKIDIPSFVLSLFLAVLLLVCISFKKYNSPVLLTSNIYQRLTSVVCVTGFCAIIYGAIRGVFYLFINGTLLPPPKREKPHSFLL